MKRPIFSSIVACSAVFGLLLSSANTQAAPLTLTAKVNVTTLVRADGTPPQVITLRRNQVFLFNGHSVRAGDSVDVIFTKGGDSFRVPNNLGNPLPFDLLGGIAIPLKGPATVTISGKGLVAYEIQTL
ncbi:MAG: hypothetical protein MN733_20930 [Nitrososphaera sp.]|nr:hypothetical protein [Nitrososphaera sp.]